MNTNFSSLRDEIGKWSLKSDEDVHFFIKILP